MQSSVIFSKSVCQYVFFAGVYSLYVFTNIEPLVYSSLNIRKELQCWTIFHCKAWREGWWWHFAFRNYIDIIKSYYISQYGLWNVLIFLQIHMGLSKKYGEISPSFLFLFFSRLLNLSLSSDLVPDQDVIDIIIHVGRNPHGRHLAWRYFREKWDVLNSRYASQAVFSSYLSVCLVKNICIFCLE